MSAYNYIQDSLLQSGSLRDSLPQQAQDRLMPPVFQDSIAQAGGAAKGAFREVSHKEIFGHAARRVSAAADTPPLHNGLMEPGKFGAEGTLAEQGGFTLHDGAAENTIGGWDVFSGETIFQIAVLALMAVWTYIVFRHLAESGQFLRLMFAAKRERHSADDFQSVLMPFANAMMLVFFFGWGIAAATAAGRFGIGGTDPILPAWAIVAVVSVTLAIIYLIKILLLKITGSLTFSDETVKRLLWYKRIFMANFAILATPAIALSSLSPVVPAIVFASIALAIGLLMVLWLAGRTFGLFMRQKISILFWILYLCGVELIPVGIVVWAAFRNTAF